jgi:hypothetical protein
MYAWPLDFRHETLRRESRLRSGIPYRGDRQHGAAWINVPVASLMTSTPKHRQEQGVDLRARGLWPSPNFMLRRSLRYEEVQSWFGKGTEVNVVWRAVPCLVETLLVVVRFPRGEGNFRRLWEAGFRRAG